MYSYSTQSTFVNNSFQGGGSRPFCVHSDRNLCIIIDSNPESHFLSFISLDRSWMPKENIIFNFIIKFFNVVKS